MRIAFIRRRFSPTGGAEHYLERLAQQLYQQGHHLTLVCEAWRSPQGQELFHHIEHIASTNPRSFAQKLQERQLPSSFDLVFSLERVFSCDLYRAGDGVHADWLEKRVQYAPLLGRLRNAIRPKNRDILALEKKVFHPENTRHIIANSQSVRESIIHRFAYPSECISVIYNGVDTDFFGQGDRQKGREALGLSQKEFVVLFVGAGAERKGLHYAQKALSQVPQARWLVIDRPQSLSMADLYAAADVFYLPTLYDPFANVTLEALAAGLPIITTRHNGAAEIIHSGQEGFILERADAIQQTVAWLHDLRDPQLRKIMGEKAQKLAQQFHLKQHVEKTLALCKKIAR